MESVRRQSDKYNLNIQRFDATYGINVVLVDRNNKKVITGAQIKQDPNILGHRRGYDVYCNPDSYKNNGKPDFIYVHANGDNLIVQDKATLSAGSLGNSCSVRRLWSSIANSKEDQIAVIYEDDILMYEGFDKKIKDIFAALPKKWDFVYIDYLSYMNDTELHKTLEKVNEKLMKNNGKMNTWGAHAYIINRDSARKLLKTQDRHGNIPVDNILVEAIRSGRLKNSYISAEKIASVDTNFDSDISSIGR
jgi:GR25 family glycosyltransferase involved in LPS biosynthesis